MKCPKCSYVSHDYLDACRKCSMDLVEFKRKFKLLVLKPGELDLGVLVNVGGADISNRDGFSVEDTIPNTPPSQFYLGLNEMTAVPEIDLPFDSDTPETSTEPGELTKTFYIPEVLAKQPPDVHLPDREAGLDEMTAVPEIDLPFDPDTPKTSTEPRGLTKMFYVGLDEMTAEPEADTPFATDNPELLAEKTTNLSAAEPDGTMPSTNSESSTQYAQHPPEKTIDMRVGNLDDGFDEFEDIQLDTAEIDHDIDFTRSLSSTTEIEPADNVLGLELAGTDHMSAPADERNTDTETGGMSSPDVREDREKI